MVVKRKFDNTHLSIDTVEETKLVHRDYIAHCHRWTFVCRWIYRADRSFAPCGGARYLYANFLDFGCGVDIPLYKMLCSNKFGKTASYRGVDINNLDDSLGTKFKGRKLPVTLYGERDLLSLTAKEIGDTNIVTSFEVLEHVPPDYARDAVKFIYDILPEGGYFIMSTPCYDKDIGAAGNHINEMTRDAVGYLLESTGFNITENYGTFASEKDYKEYLSPEQLIVFKQLQPYYNSHYLATIFAPFFPEHSRNNLWVAQKSKMKLQRRFPEKPKDNWSQHEDWKELLK